MRTRRFSRVAVLYVVCGFAMPAGAQVLPIETTFVEERPVVMLPSAAAALSGSATTGDVSIRVTTDENLRTYRAFHQGRIHTAYEDTSQPVTRLVFDPVARRFRSISPTIRVDLHDADSLDSLVRDQGALHGNAYPELGFALVRFGPDADLPRAVELLNVDARVREARLHFEPALRHPMIAGETPEPRKTPSSGLPAKTRPMESLDADLFVSFDIDIYTTDFGIDATVYNFGAGATDSATLRAQLFSIVPDDSTEDADDRTISVIDEDDTVIPALDGKGDRFETNLEFDTSELDAGETYYVSLSVLDGAFFLDDADTLTRNFTGFTLDSLQRVQHVCLESGRGSVSGTPDLLLEQQWSLTNTGQSGYAASGGASGEDLQMADVLADGPTGEWVRVAVVDTGLETCHPDLKSNVEAGASFNFNAEEAIYAQYLPRTFRNEALDPFNFDSTGDHGTSVSGLVAAQGNNGIGIRGVAPDVALRGYNFLNAVDQLTALIGSLGASSFFPNSSDVDIFNLSWGSAGSRPQNPDALTEQIFSHGTRSLRSGLGAIYVKAGGNGFDDCRSLERTINEEIGCVSSTGDDINNLPYPIVVGAFNADGRKSSYSSAGPNLWISAPGGEYGRSKPALASVDQMGWKRGFSAILNEVYDREAPLDDESAANPDGDYMARMNGTSAAAANVSGAVAVLLQEAAGLTWRDVKYVLARTARRIDPDIESVQETFGANARTLRLAWTENAAGYAYHDWYGFGALDLDAAIAFAREYTPDSLGEFRQSGWFGKNEPVSIPDEDGTGATQMVTVSGLTDDASIEAVVLEIDIDHPFPNDLGIHLVSPHGTRTVVNQVFNETLVIDGSLLNWRILSNAFFGETPNGNWQIDVFDGAADDTGSLEAWRLQFYYGTHPVEDDEGDDDDGSEPARHVAIVAAEGVEVLRQELPAQ